MGLRNEYRTGEQGMRNNEVKANSERLKNDYSTEVQEIMIYEFKAGAN